MPKLDPDDQSTITAAPAPTPSFFGGASPAVTPAPMVSAAPAPAPGGFAPAPGGFGSSPGFGGSQFGSPQGGYNSGGGMNSQQQNNAMANAATANAFGNVMAAQAASGAEPEHWMKSFWRPAMGWLYMLICFCDFIVFPALTMFLPVIERMFGLTMGYTPWQSLTLSNGGLIHLSFGAILGVSAYGRSKEKETGVAKG